MGSPRVQRGPAAAPKSPVRPPPAKRAAAGKSGNRPASNATRGPVGASTADADAVGAPASKRVLRSQGRRTMRKLLDAAMVAFDRRGYHATRVNDVVEIAKTSHGTFYLYFSNKEDLLRALVAEAAGEGQVLYDSLRALPSDGDSPRWEDVHAWVRSYSDLWTRYAPLFRTWPDLATIDPALVEMIRGIFTAMSRAFAEHIKSDSSGHVINADTAGLATLAMLDRFHFLREFVGPPVDEVALETLTTMVYRALFDPRA